MGFYAIVGQILSDTALAPLARAQSRLLHLIPTLVFIAIIAAVLRNSTKSGDNAERRTHGRAEEGDAAKSPSNRRDRGGGGHCGDGRPLEQAARVPECLQPPLSLPLIIACKL